MDLKDIKLEYNREELNKENLASNPYQQVKSWFSEAVNAEVSYPNAVTLSTVSSKNIPSSRIVLIKDILPQGITFFTNYNSHKAQDIEANGHVSVLFFWKELDRQIRVTGTIKKLSRKDSKEYFLSRPRESQLSAIASNQSHEVTKDQLYKTVAEVTQKYSDKEVICPENWGGYIVDYSEVEVWQGRPNRLHDRFIYSLNEKNEWNILRLAP